LLNTHLWPHVLQLFLSLSRLASQSASLPSQLPQLPPPQSSSCGGTVQSAAVHTPPLQLALSHVLSHAAQCSSVSSGVSQPSSGERSSLQSPQPGLHCVNLHVPVSHETSAFLIAHGVSQPPQRSVVLIGVSQPVPGSWSQSSKSAAQCSWHACDVQ